VFYDYFSELCKQKGISVTKATEEIGLARTIGTKWKNTGATPNGATLAKIADYFGVTVSYLLGEQEKPTLSGELSDARKQLDAAIDDMSDEELLFLMSKVKAIKDSRI
jgi:transcriptional regulator with XRE-family HTH domain